jgi:two-component system LytT family response regulator
MTTRIRAIIVDDEISGRNSLRGMLNYFPIVNILGEAKNCTEAVQLIQDVKPELVFLDIEMPYGSGFDVLQQFEQINFNVIFVTAYEEYALRALKLSATDYLLKPVDKKELELALDKVIQKSTAKTAQHFHQLRNDLHSGRKPEKIAIPHQGDIEYIDIKDIIRCESDKGYTWFYLLNQKKYLVTKTLGDFEQLLGEYGFFRVHHSHLVNLNYVEKYNKGRGGSVQMCDQKEIEVSVRRKDDFLHQMNLFQK